MKANLFSLPDKGVLSVAISQFGSAFSMNFIAVFMPFYIRKISSFGPKETMVWTGLIIGVSPLMACLMAPVWGRMTSRLRPKLLFERALLCNGMILLLYGFAGNLYVLFFLRVMIGLLGGASTVGLILLSAISNKERLHKDISLYQISQTTAQLIGPPLGAYMVTLAGYRASFFIASFVLFTFFIFCYRYVKDIPCQKTDRKSGQPQRKGILWGWALGFIATIHITYLPSILPHILETFQLKEDTALNSAGLIMMAYTVTAILGNYLITNFASRARLRQVVMYIGLLAASFQAAMYFTNGVFSFTVIRMLQTGVIAAVFPMILSVFASGAGGGTLGLVNSARFGGNAVGPLMATSVLAYSNLLTLYLIITGFTLVAVVAFLRATKVTPSGEH